MEIESILLQAIPCIVNKIPMAETLLMMLNRSHTTELGFHLQADPLIIRKITLMGKI